MSKNPHMSLARQGKPPVNHWKCTDCGEEGTLDDLRGGECSYIHEPCRFCGQTPECAPDCIGILGVLAGKNVYIAGLLDGDDHNE